MTRILIADDNAQSLYMLETVLKSCGYEVISARNGAEAIAMALKNPPGIIVTDILMPEMDGFELCRRCKSDERLQDIPLIFYTATYTDLKDEQFALSLGADRFIVKPQQPEVLVQIIQEVLTKPRNERKVFQKISTTNEKEVLQRYNEVLFRKLEHKVEALENIIEKQKQIENELRESEERYRSVFETSDDAILMTAPDGSIFTANPAACRMFGCTEAELVQLGRKGMIDSTDSRLTAALEQRKRTGRFRGELTFLRKDGQSFPGELSSVVFQDKDGQARTSMIIHDITEFKRVEEERQRVARLESVGILAGGIAHDFNNILTSILGNISLATLKSQPDNEISTLLKEAEKASLRARDLVQQLLTFANGGTPVKKIVFIHELVNDTASFALRGSNIQCQISIPDTLWQVDVDPGQIGQVISNLVINARQAMPEGGTIEIDACNITVTEQQILGKSLPLKIGDYIRITIADHGIGIPSHYIDKIFDPYFTTKQSGSGLGLASSYSIIRKHDGYIYVESELAVGTTFYIYLPASQQKIMEIEKSAMNNAPVIPGRILIMDDESSICEILGEMLRYIGYADISFAANGSEAIQIYQEAMKAGKPFAAVILDLTIPGGMGGREAIQKLLQIDPKVKAIVSSGYSSEAIMSDVRQNGFKGVIAKPYTLEQLKDVLSKVIGDNLSDSGTE